MFVRKSCVSSLSEVNDIEEDLPDGEMADDEDMSDPKEVDEVSLFVTQCLQWSLPSKNSFKNKHL